MLEMKSVGKSCAGKSHARFDEGKLAIGYGCDIVVLTEEKVRNSKHRLQPAATTPALYSNGFV
jgi:hypothetical protein